MEIHVCGREQAGDFADKGITHYLSLEDPEIPEEKPAWAPSDYLRVSFHDVDFEDPLRPDIKGPSKDDVQKILDFCQSAEGGNLLIQGMMGIGRSSSVALVLHQKAMGGPGNEQPVIDKILAIKDDVMPNVLVVRHAEEILGWDGGLSAKLNELKEIQVQKLHQQLTEEG